jgi:pimeloyl-ACP methyl ester carboxylesterase
LLARWRRRRSALTPIENVGFVVDVAYTTDGSVVAGTTNGLVRFSTIPGAGHFLTDQVPDVVNALLLEHLVANPA